MIKDYTQAFSCIRTLKMLAIQSNIIEINTIFYTSKSDHSTLHLAAFNRSLIFLHHAFTLVRFLILIRVYDHPHTIYFRW